MRFFNTYNPQEVILMPKIIILVHKSSKKYQHAKERVNLLKYFQLLWPLG